MKLEVEVQLYYKLMAALQNCRRLFSLVTTPTPSTITIPEPVTVTTTVTTTTISGQVIVTNTSTEWPIENNTQWHNAKVCSSPNVLNLTDKARTTQLGGDICDLADIRFKLNWFRFTGEAGNRLRDTCPSGVYNCGSHGGIWSNVYKPPADLFVKNNIVAFGSSQGVCRRYRLAMQVIRCGEGDFIYRAMGHFGKCRLGFCGMV